MARWMVLAGDALGRKVRDHLLAGDPVAHVDFAQGPAELRAALRGPQTGSCVVVGEGVDGPAPVNVAAAVVADGFASEVDLVVSRASGSLRSRAKRAGVTRVLTVGELVARPAGAHEGAKGASRASGASKGRAAGEGSSGEEARSGATHGEGAEVERAAGASRGEVPTGAGESAAPGRLAEAASGPPALERRPGVPVICFVSGRGGVGKTTACALAGHIAASWGMRVGMLDLDLAFGNLFSHCGLERPADLTPLAGPGECTAEAIDSCARQAGEGLRVWGPCVAPEYAELVQPLAERILARLTHGCDLVLVDTTTNWGDAVASAAQRADRLVIVSDERPGAVATLARCGSLAVRLGVARTRIVRLMNGCDPRGRDETYVARAARGLECARELRVHDGGDEAVDLLAAGHAGELAVTDNPLASSLATGLAQVLRELGCLPECEATQRALEGRRKARRFLGFGREVA